MKFQYRAALSCALLVATLPTVQAETSSTPIEVTGNVAFTTDYVFRGISLSEENLAIQGQFDATHSSGAYIGTWASSVSGYGPGGSAELDVYVGYAGEINGFGYDVFATRFIYPASGKGDTTKDHQYNDYHEYTLALSYSLSMGTTFGIQYDYAPHWAGESTGTAENYLFNVIHDLGDGLSIGASVGRQEFRDDNAIRQFNADDFGNEGVDDYTYYGANVSYSVNDFTLSLDFSDTNIENNGNGNDVEDASDGRVYFTLSKEF